MPGIKITAESVQKASGNYFPNDSDRSGIRDGSVTQQDLGTSLTGSLFPYKIYKAILSQSGTDAPVPVILENTIGEIVWTRNGTGRYRATLSNAFPFDKTVFFTNRHTNSLIADRTFAELGHVSASILELKTFAYGVTVYSASAGVISVTNLDDQLWDTAVEIQVYP